MARKDIGRQVDEAIKKKFDKKVKDTQPTKKQLEHLGEVAVEEIRKVISKGISPIEGKNRFPAYKNPKRYPGGVRKKFPAKRKRPVNLFLSGKFLNDLRVKVEKSSGKLKHRLRVGFSSKLSQDKERGHREGAMGQPKRPVIPSKNEQFSRRVKKSMIAAFKKAMMKNIARNR